METPSTQNSPQPSEDVLRAKESAAQQSIDELRERLKNRSYWLRGPDPLDPETDLAELGL